MTVEKINQNDMAARITAAVESGSGADVIQMNANQPHLFANGIAEHDELLEEILGDQVYEGRSAPPRWKASPVACPPSTSPTRSSTGRTCSRSWASPAQHLGRVSRGRPAAEEQQPAGRPDARPHLRRRADLLLSVDVELRRAGSRRLRQGGDQFRRHPQGAGLHEGVLGSGLRPRRVCLGRHQQQPRFPGPDDRRDPERRQHLFRQRRTTPDRIRAWPGTSTTSSIRRARPAGSISSARARSPS